MACTQEENDYLREKSRRGMQEATSPIEKLRYACLARGASGIKGLGRSFCIMDDDGSKTLDFNEFRNGLHDYGLDLDAQTISDIFHELDKDGSGKLSYDEFLVAIRGPMNQSRIAMVDKAYAKLDASGDGVVTIEDIRMLYSVEHHPKYQSGEWTADQCFRHFLDSFDSPYDKDGIVTRDEFINYYNGVSASIDDDGYFRRMMIRAWKL